MDDVQAPQASAEDSSLAPVPASPRDEPDDDESGDFERLLGHWRYELRRWLATLNPGRTGHEYEKAVAYFFCTPGVPQQVSDLSFDLLLAYRGALALRAADPARGGAQTTASASLRPRGALSPAPPRARLTDGNTPGRAAENYERDAPAGDDADQTTATPLAPATVNIRLTALRQFLVHCTQVGSLTHLTPDAIRAALRRLRIERRRPYQVLAEPEWEGFLAAALDVTSSPPAGQGDDHAAPGAQTSWGERSPWGTPRAAREGTAATAASARSTSGGQATAQRDHALLSLALATGLRAIELSLLDTGDLVREWHAGEPEWWLVLPDSKTKGQHGGRTLPLAAPLVELLHAYLRATGRRWDDPADRATPLFLSRHGNGRGRLSTVQMRRIVDRVERRWAAGRGHGGGGDGDGDGTSGDGRAISPHALRHSTAIALLEGNLAAGRPPASVEHVRGWLGHFDIRTTQGYLAHLDARRHRRPFTISPASSTSSPSSPAPPGAAAANAADQKPADDSAELAPDGENGAR